MMNPNHCKACKALIAECGEDHWDMYSVKLLRAGWAGHRSPVENAFIRAHKKPSKAQQKAWEGAKGRLARIRAAGSRVLATENKD